MAEDWQWKKTPTNGQAAKRPYCHKHHRAMLDIGGTKQCVKCIEESALKKRGGSGRMRWLGGTGDE